jgi:hypothetical protein
MLSEDDDSFFIILVDKNKKVFPVNLFKLNDSGRESFITFLEQEYDINVLTEEFENKKNIILFPKLLIGEKLFINKLSLKLIFALSHESILGELTQPIINYIDSIN